MLHSDRVARCEDWLLQLPCEPLVPRTYVLTDVTPVDQLADRLAQLDRNLFAQLDREIRDAPPRIELPRRGDRLRRTRVDASRARATPVRLERRIHLELEIQHQRAEKEERPALGIDEVRVLPEPAESRAPRE